MQRSAAARELTQKADEDNNWIAATVGVTEVVALDQLAAAVPSPPLTEERTTLMSLFDSDDEEPPAPLLPPPNNFEATPTPQQREAVPKRSGGRAKRCGSCASCSSGNRKLKCEALMARSLGSAGSSCESDADSQRSLRSITPSSAGSGSCEPISEDGGSACGSNSGRAVRAKKNRRSSGDGSAAGASSARSRHSKAAAESRRERKRTQAAPTPPPPPAVGQVTSSTSRVRFAKGSTPQPQARRVAGSRSTCAIYLQI